MSFIDMIKIDDFFKSGTPLGIAIGIGATVFATAVVPVLPVLAKAARPSSCPCRHRNVSMTLRHQVGLFSV
ncbi:MAG: hypothetical protein ACXW0T_08800 [Methylobacter sp.]